MKITEEQVLALAPDPSSAKSGKDLANPKKWVSKAFNEKALWGECQGSGSSPYRTQVDLGNIAFKCSCPSRKFPCKHGIGLMLLFVRQPDAFALADMPAWVTDWIGKREQKSEQKTEDKPKEIDKAAQAKRAEKREKKVQEGILELQLWIKDLFRNGLMQIPEQSYNFYQTMAARLVDAQAPGLSAMVKALGEIDFFGNRWQADLLQQLAKIYLLTKAYQTKETLPPELNKEVMSLAGWNQSKEELLQKEGVADHWQVLGKYTSQEETMTVERYWLFGLQHQKYALLLNFIFPGQASQMTLMAGQAFEGELVYFDAAYPMRALIKAQNEPKDWMMGQGYQNWQEAMKAYATALATNPWTDWFPMLMQNIIPVVAGDKWFLYDRDTHAVGVSQKSENLFVMISASGGRPMDLFVVKKGENFIPLAYWVNKN